VGETVRITWYMPSDLEVSQVAFRQIPDNNTVRLEWQLRER
jgi:hypothetical protein